MKAMKYQNQPDLKASPFASLASVEIQVTIPQEQYHFKCPEVKRLGKDHRLVVAIWASTQGNPCRKCNRLKGCKLHIKS